MRPHDRERIGLSGGQTPRHPRREAVGILLRAGAVIALAPIAACSGGKGGNSGAVGSTPSSVDAGAAASGHGLLLPRDQRLMVRNMATGAETVIKHAPPDFYYTFPRWSPDGKQIAWGMDLPFTGQPNQQWGTDIVVGAADGSSERTIFKRPTSGLKVDGLAWSADGLALYAGVTETVIEQGKFISQTFRIERIDVASGARTKLVDSASYPAASADGNWLAYITFGDADQPGGLWLAKPDGSQPKMLVAASGKFVAVYYPRFSPDSKTIAFSAAALGAGTAPVQSTPTARRWPWEATPAQAHGIPMDIWLVSIDGGDPRRLTTFLEDEPYSAWSPDGTQLAIVATGGLYTVAVAGGNPNKLGIGGTLLQIDWR